MSITPHCQTKWQKVRSRATCNTSPWITDTVHSLRGNCCRTERLGKATGLEVYCSYLEDLVYSFNMVAKEARTAYFANLICSSKRNTKDDIRYY